MRRHSPLRDRRCSVQRHGDATPGRLRIPVERFPHGGGRCDKAPVRAAQTTAPSRWGRWRSVSPRAGGQSGKGEQLKSRIMSANQGSCLTASPPAEVPGHRSSRSGEVAESGATRPVPACRSLAERQSATRGQDGSTTADSTLCWRTPASGQNTARLPSPFWQSPVRVGPCWSGPDPRARCEDVHRADSSRPHSSVCPSRSRLPVRSRWITACRCGTLDVAGSTAPLIGLHRL